MSGNFHETSQFTAERYLLGELTAEERDQFEEHYFSCPACAQSVLAGAAFLDTSRAVLPEFQTAAPSPAPAKPRFPWFSWRLAPQFAFATIALLAVFDDVRAHSASDRLTLSAATQINASRAASHLTLSSKSPRTAWIVPAKWDGTYSSYRAEIQNSETSQVVQSSALAPSGDSLIVSVLPATLGQGKYLMLIYGVSPSGDKHLVDQYPFAVRN